MDFFIKEESLRTFFKIHESEYSDSNAYSKLQADEIFYPIDETRGKFNVGDSIIFSISDTTRKIGIKIAVVITYKVEEYDNVSYKLTKIK